MNPESKKSEPVSSLPLGTHLLCKWSCHNSAFTGGHNYRLLCNIQLHTPQDNRSSQTPVAVLAGVAARASAW